MAKRARDDRLPPPGEPFGSRPFAGLEKLRASLPDHPGGPTAAPSGPPAAAPGLPSRAVVRRERKGHGGKTVTRIEQLGLEGAGLGELARELRRDLGCGARSEGEDLLVQGDQVERVATWLEARGVPRVVRGN